MIDECKTIIEKVAELSNIVAKDPISNADLISDLSTLSAWIYDKQYTSYSKYEKKYITYGVPGILPTLISYTKLIRDIGHDGGYEHQQEELRKSKVNLQKAVDKAKELIQKIEDKM